jgi:uncharacterized membrane protein
VLIYRKKVHSYLRTRLRFEIKSFLLIALVEEMLFVLGLIFWAYIRGFSPDIHGLEKYMDFGFINSILRADFFPPKDMWFTPFPINYYYFGHLATAMLTKLTGLPSNITYNIMLATIFAFCFVSVFSISTTLASHFFVRLKTQVRPVIISGLLSATLVTLGGNLHTVYTFFSPYENEKPVPPWALEFRPFSFPNNYWYPNATRFIYNTIHEFPMYSWTVADLHGHVLDIPFVLLTIAAILALFLKFQSSNQEARLKKRMKSASLFHTEIWKFQTGYCVLIGFLLAVLYMTNAWDGIIYFLLAIFAVSVLQMKKLRFIPPSFFKIGQIFQTNRQQFVNTFYMIAIIGVSFFIFLQPFSRYFEPFVSGIGILCAPKFLTDIGHLGPILFEKDHCQHSPLWQLIILHGFFIFFATSFILFIRKKRKETSDIFVLILILLSFLLILLPEFIYAKDIYPAHYRANTMFKLVFQAFIMLGITTGYIFIRIFTYTKDNNLIKVAHRYFFFFLFFFIFFLLVMIYPYMAINSYYGNLKNYYGLDGTKYLQNLYPDDYALIQWINNNIQGQPVILEAQGDSYTDYARVSANTGLPTVLGWTVHEWLWRGSYDIPSPRITEVIMLYESEDINLTRSLLKKYNIQYVFVGDLERQKYPKMHEEKFQKLGKIIYKKGESKLYKVG